MTRFRRLQTHPASSELEFAIEIIGYVPFAKYRQLSLLSFSYWMSSAQSPAAFRDEPPSVRLTGLRWICGNASVNRLFRRCCCCCCYIENWEAYTRTLDEISDRADSPRSTFHVHHVIITDYSREWSHAPIPVLVRRGMRRALPRERKRSS